MGADDPKDDDSSSGISLNELPDDVPLDENAESLKQRVDSLRAKKRWEKSQQQNQKFQTLAKLSDEEKLMAMSRVYEFDKRDIRFLAISLCLLPVAFKYLKVFKVAADLFAENSGNLNLSSIMLSSTLRNLDSIMQFAEAYSVALFFIVSPLKSTSQRFTVSFEGVEVPVSLKLKMTLANQRKKIRWEDIVMVKRIHDVIPGIQLCDIDRNPLGEMRWDLRKKDKRAVLKLLCRYVGDKHPLRKLVEQELA